MSAPKGADAIRRRLVSFPNMTGGRSIARLVYVDRKGTAKVRLPSGAHIVVPSADVHVLPDPPRSLPT